MPILRIHHASLWRAARVVLTIALLWLLLRTCEWRDAAAIWRSVDAAWLLAAAILLNLSLVLGAASLLVLFELAGHPRWWARFSVDYLHVQALCQFTPAQAGEAVLPFVAGRGRFRPGAIAASLLVQRMTALAIVAAVALAGTGKWVPRGHLWAAATALLLLCLALIAIVRNARARAWINALVQRRFGAVLDGFYDTWSGVIRKRRARFLLHVALMMARFFIGVAGSAALFAAFGIVVPLADLAVLSALATLAALMPITVNGIGVTEGLFVAALAGYGYGSEQALSACLTGRILGILVLLCWSIPFWLLRRRDHNTGQTGNAAGLPPR